MNKKKTNKIRIAIQGGFGAFHEMAAYGYFTDKDIEIVPQDTFKDLMLSLSNGKVDYAIMAIENSVAGSILPNYKLLQESGEKIIGEIYLRIRQNLVALPGQRIRDIREVYSHPMAIMQCEKFFEKHPHIKLVDSIDTALSAKMIAEKKLKNVGAIASSLAADMYKLETLAAGIETNKKNYTRFLILEINGKRVSSIRNVNKASVYFTLSHEVGSLSKILSILFYYNINLSKIQSMPVIGVRWQYQFYIDVEFDNYDRYIHALQAVKPFTGSLGIMGEYSKGISII